MSGQHAITTGPFAEWVWENKYRFKPANGEGGDTTIDDTFKRVARTLASAEPTDARKWEAEFYHAMRGYAFLPAGRIIAGAGTGRSVTMFNCYVMGQIEDSLDGIMKAVGEAAATLKQGGGVGMDFSTLRPRGALVRGVESVSSGAVSFMDIWNTMCGTIISAGARRGAMMATLRCDHPDIIEFIEAKRTPGRLTNFNVSVLATDPFMAAVKSGSEWPLVFGGQVYSTINAADLWQRIIKLTYDYAEPGIIFIDRINKTNNLNYCETIHATNPCAEQPLPPYGACLLGSLNLTQFIADPFTSYAMFDVDAVRRVTRTAVRMLDNVNDISGFPLESQRVEALSKRRIGLGVTGLADALIMTGLRYGTPIAADMVKKWMQTIEEAAVDESSKLGVEKGSFPLHDIVQFPGGFASRRNSHLTSIAPTGTISNLAGNVSSGIEPVFEWAYTRRVLQPDGTHLEVRVEDYARRLAAYMGEKGLRCDPRGDAWVTSSELTVDDHLRMTAAVQQHVDSSISKTINCPESMRFEDFEAVYQKAYDMGLKGCTTYRPTPERGAVLIRDNSAKGDPELPTTSQTGNVVQIGEPLGRNEMLKGRTYKLKPPGREHAHYITINDIEHQGRRRPFEIFINTKEVDGHEWKVALSRMLSAVLRKAGDVSFVAEELRQVHDPRGGFWMDGVYVPSLCSAIGGIIERHLRETGYGEQQGHAEVAPATERHCPKCQVGALRMQEGCAMCGSCDYTKCG